MTISEARIEQTDAGLAPTGPGWFVVNARGARWRHRPGCGNSLPLTGFTDEECETYFPQTGIALVVLGPGEPIGLYHWENDQEDFLVLAGEGNLVIEGEERPLRQWDFVHCPPGTQHAIVGAGEGCTVLAIGAREHVDQNCHGGAYAVDRSPGATARASTKRRPTRRSTTHACSGRPGRRGTARNGCPERVTYAHST
jgi:uncharacterized cupin superfamily protein